MGRPVDWSPLAGTDPVPGDPWGGGGGAAGGLLVVGYGATKMQKGWPEGSA
jgi:hypothetical protein